MSDAAIRHHKFFLSVFIRTTLPKSLLSVRKFYRKERKVHKEKVFRLCDLCVLCGYHLWLRPEAALGPSVV